MSNSSFFTLVKRSLVGDSKQNISKDEDGLGCSDSENMKSKSGIYSYSDTAKLIAAETEYYDRIVTASKAMGIKQNKYNTNNLIEVYERVSKFNKELVAPSVNKYNEFLNQGIDELLHELIQVCSDDCTDFIELKKMANIVSFIVNVFVDDNKSIISCLSSDSENSHLLLNFVHCFDVIADYKVFNILLRKEFGEHLSLPLLSLFDLVISKLNENISEWQKLSIYLSEVFKDFKTRKVNGSVDINENLVLFEKKIKELMEHNLLYLNILIHMVHLIGKNFQLDKTHRKDEQSLSPPWNMEKLKEFGFQLHCNEQTKNNGQNENTFPPVSDSMYNINKSEFQVDGSQHMTSWGYILMNIGGLDSLIQLAKSLNDFLQISQNFISDKSYYEENVVKIRNSAIILQTEVIHVIVESSRAFPLACLKHTLGGSGSKSMINDIVKLSPVNGDTKNNLINFVINVRLFLLMKCELIWHCVNATSCSHHDLINLSFFSSYINDIITSNSVFDPNNNVTQYVISKELRFLYGYQENEPASSLFKNQDLWPWIKDNSTVSSELSFFSANSNNSFDYDYHLCTQNDIFSLSLTQFKIIELNFSTWKIFFSAVINIISFITSSNCSIEAQDSIIEQFLEYIAVTSQNSFNLLQGTLFHLLVPLYQIYYTLFLDLLLQQYNVRCANWLSSTSCVKILFGDFFLGADVIRHTGAPDTTNFFYVYEKADLSQIYTESWISDTSNFHGVRIYLWIRLHDIILDFLKNLCMTKYNVVLKSGASTLTVPSESFFDMGSNRTLWNEVLEVSFLLVTLNDQKKSNNVVSGNKSLPNCTTLRLVRFLNNMFNHVDISKVPEITIAVLKCLLSASSEQLSLMGICRLEPIHDSHLVQVKDPFFIPARIGTIKLILSLYARSSVQAKGICLDAFMDTSLEFVTAYDLQDQSKSSRSTSFSDISSLSEATTVTAKAGYLRLNKLFLHLLDPLTRFMALQIIVGIIISCAREYEKLQEIEKGEKGENEKKTNLRKSSYDVGSSVTINTLSINALVIDTLRLLTIFIGWSTSYAPDFDCSTGAINVMSLLTWVFRSSLFKPIRVLLQQFVLKSDSIFNLLIHLSDCLNVSDKSLCSILTRRTIMHHGLSLLFSILKDNESCQSDLQSILLSSGTNYNGNIVGSKKSSRKLTYAEFVQYILIACPGNSSQNPSNILVSLETVIILIEIMFDKIFEEYHSILLHEESVESIQTTGLFYNDGDRPRIKNISIVPILFYLIQYCSNIKLQKFIIYTFQNLITGRASIVNLNTLTAHIRPKSALDLSLECLPHLVDEVQDHLVIFIQTLGKHGISVSQLKHIFMMFQSKEYNGVKVRPSYTSKVIKALQGMICDDENPRHTFVFDGNNSGLQLVPIFKWPSPKAFTISLWLKIESPKDSNTMLIETDTDIKEFNSYCPYILSLRSENGAGLEIYLRSTIVPGEFRVVVTGFNENSETSILCPELVGMVVHEGQWTFVAASFQSAKFRTKSFACVMINEKFVKYDFSFPILNDPIMEPLIGECPMKYKNMPKNTTMRGQMGAIYFFSDALSEGQLRSIYELGSSYFYSFEPSSRLDVTTSRAGTKKQTVNPSGILDGSLTSLIMLAFNPAVWNTEVYLDNTPSANKVKWKERNAVLSHSTSSKKSTQVVLNDSPFDVNLEGKMFAKPLPGTNRTTTQDLRMAFDSLGGVKALLPIIERLDQSILRYGKNTMTEIVENYIDDVHVDTELSLAIFEFLYTIIDGSKENGAVLKKNHYFSVVSNFLENVSPLHFNGPFLRICISIYECTSNNLQNQLGVFEGILTNFRLWLFSPYEVQLELLTWLLKIARSNPSRIGDLLSIQRLLDVLALYEYEIVDDASHFSRIYNVSSWNHKGAANMRKLQGVEMSNVRSYFLQLLRLIMQPACNAIQPHEFVPIVNHLIHIRCSRCKIEILQFVVSYLDNNDNTILSVLTALVQVQIVPILSNLCADNNPKLRLNAFIFLMKLINMASVHKVLESNVVQQSTTNVLHEIPQSLSEFYRSFYAQLEERQLFGLEAPDFSKTIDSLGLHSSVFYVILVYFMDILKDKLVDSRNSEKESEFITTGLYLTLYGENCDGLFKYIDIIYDDAYIVSSKSDVTSVFLGNSLQESKICVPVLFPILLNFINSDKVSSSLRLLITVKLKSTVTLYDENADNILKIPTWQNAIFRLIISETNRLHHLRENVASSKDTSNKKIIDKCEAMVDTCKYLLVDLIVKAVYIGQPLSFWGHISRKDEQMKSLTIQEVFNDISNGDRLIGAITLRETIKTVKAFSESGALDFQKEGTELLQKTIDALKNENYFSRQGLSLKDVKSDAASMKPWADKMRHLNIWIVAYAVFELLSTDSQEENSDKAFSSGSEQDSARSSLINTSSTIANVTWNIVVTLLGLLTDWMTDSPQWILEDKSFRLGQAPAPPPQVKVVDVTAETHGKPKSIPTSSMTGGLFWMIVRVFCLLLCRPNKLDVVNDIFITKALSYLKLLLKSCFKDMENVDFETANLISHLSYFLQNTDLSIDSPVIIGVIEFLLELISSELTMVRSILCSRSIRTSFESRQSQRETFIRFANNLNSSEKYDSSPIIDLFTSKESSIIDVNSMFGKSSSVQDIMASIVHRNYSGSFCKTDVTAVAFEAVKQVLGNFVPTSGIHELDFSWEIWLHAMDLIFIEGYKIEISSISSRLAEMGITTTVNLQGDTDTFNSQQLFIVQDWSTKVNKSIVSKENDRCKEVFRSLENLRRKTESRWKDIYGTLANDRGPWGVQWINGADEKNKVYWMMDNVENDMRVRFRMIRNASGCSHSIASRITKGAHEVNAMNDNKNDKINFTKELLKYKKVSTEAAADDGDEAGSDDENVVNRISEEVQKERDGILAETALFSSECDIITCGSSHSGGETTGKIEVRKQELRFTRSCDEFNPDMLDRGGNYEYNWVTRCYGSKTWNMNEIVAMYQRHYLLQFTAIELFFNSRLSIFINFPNSETASKMYKCIKQMRLPYLYCLPTRQPEEAIKRALKPVSNRTSRVLWMQGEVDTIQQLWIKREISNFEYLMHLNTIAGRTFNDLGQYPVFPWVIKDYTSSRIDLRKKETFRDLEWPMGALTKKQQEDCIMRFQDQNESYQYNPKDEIPPFHHGSHYSTAAFVYWYLIRLEPFTSLHILLQSGKFDKPDRLFYSVQSAWNGCLNNAADVKELIPEFFCCPEMFENHNDVDLGVMQNKEKVGPVVLPPWCRNAHDFVRINREALESEYVSQNLHHWIDLIFGYKQRPPFIEHPKLKGDQAAIDYCNVFFHLTYVGAVDLEKLKVEDENLYKSYLRQIDNFGQTPNRLFDRPHPKRLELSKTEFIWPIASIIRGYDTMSREEAELCKYEKPKKIVSFPEFNVSSFPILFIVELKSSEHLITIDANRNIGVHTFKVKKPDVVPPFQLEISGTTGLISSLFYKATPKICGVPFASKGLITQAHGAVAYLDASKIEVIGTKHNKELLIKEENDRRSRESSRLKLMQAHEKSKQSVPISSSQSSNTSTISNSTTLESTSPGTSPSTPTTKQSVSAPNSKGISPTRASSTSDNYSRYSSLPNGRRDSGISIGSSTKSNGFVGTRREGLYDHLSCNLFTTINCNSRPQLVFSCGHWDDSFKVTEAISGRLVQSVFYHRDIVTCITGTSDYGQHWIVTGSKDCTVIIWEICLDKEMPVSPSPLHVLHGHDDPVTCVAVNSEFDILVSGSIDGTLMIHTLRDGVYIRSILLGYHSTSSMPSITGPQVRRVTMLAISKEGYIVAYSNDGLNLLCTYTINGRLVKMIDAGERLFAMCLSEDGNVVLTGGERCLIVFRWVANLRLANTNSRFGLEAVVDGKDEDGDTADYFTSPIRSLVLTSSERLLIVGLESGKIRILAQDAEYLKRRLTAKLTSIGMLPSVDDG